MRVDMANGVTLPVKFIGFIVLRIPGQRPSGRIIQPCDNAQVAQRTLRAWPLCYSQQQPTSTTNNALLFLSNNHVRIRETTANFTITLSTDTFVYAVAGKNDTVERSMG
eukprot:6207263-Pleurochrysis_carterae.AAC.3